MRGNIISLLSGIILSGYNVYGQCPILDFITSDSVCISEPITLANNSINGDYFEWDLCMGDLLLMPIAEEKSTINEGATLIGIDVVKSDNYWYAFTTSRDNNSIFRLDFGPSLTNQPSIVNLGNIANFIDQPQDIKILKDNDQWFGFIQCKGNPEFIRINFGTDLSNSNPTADAILSSSGNANNGFDIAYDGNNWVAVLGKSNKITLINFGNYLGNLIDSSDIFSSTPIDGATNISDLSVHKIGNLWYGLMTSFSSKSIHILDFGNNLLNNPSFVLLDNSFLNNEIPYDISFQLDNNIPVGMISTLSGQIFRLSFSDGFDNPPLATELGNFGLLNNTLKITLEKDSSNWYAFTTNYNSNKIYQLTFPNKCPASNSFFYNQPLENVYFNSAGSFNIELRGFGRNCQEILYKSIYVQNKYAPIISFSTLNNCLSSPNVFVPTIPIDTTIISWYWDFGDSDSDSIQFPTHFYASPGDYNVQLYVEDKNGCGNSTKDTVRIYPPPTADFILEDSVLCSNDPLNLQNQTLYESPDSITTFIWNFNDERSSTAKDTSYIFTSGGDKFITLTASIPGCSSEKAQEFSLLEGPDVKFSFADVCDQETVFFNNETTGEVSDFFWDFGDGTVSSLLNPDHLYQETGDYIIHLIASSNNGCINGHQDTMRVHHLPQADFVNELPCNRSEVAFYDASTVPNANITTWEWTYQLAGDPVANETDSLQNPIFQFPYPGMYDLSLAVITNFGCRDSLQKTIEILPSPVAEFTQNQACLGDTTFFIDKSNIQGENFINRWAWQINNTMYDIQLPGIVFPEYGTYEISLTVQADNLCRDRIVKHITINLLPLADFRTENNCQNETIRFYSDAISLSDPVNQYIWDIENVGRETGPSLGINFEEPGNYAITHIVITENGCLDTLDQQISIYNAPHAAFDYYPKYGSLPFEVHFENLSTDGNTYTWDFNDKGATSNLVNPVYTYEAKGSYTSSLLVENNMGCRDSSTLLIQVADPVLDIRLDKVNAISSNGYINFTLDINNKATIPIEQMDIIIDVNGTFSLRELFLDTLYAGETIRYPLQFELSDLPGQAPEFICFELKPEVPGYEELNPWDNRDCLTLEPQFFVRDPYPNPTVGNLLLDLILPEKKDLSLQLISSDGKICQIWNYPELAEGLNSIHLDIKQAGQGIYLLRILYDEKIISKRIGVIR